MDTPILRDPRQLSRSSWQARVVTEPAVGDELLRVVDDDGLIVGGRHQEVEGLVLALARAGGGGVAVSSKASPQEPT